MRTRWTKNQAWEWYSRKKWVMGVNYVPSVTLHAVELWQEDTHAEVMQSVRKEIALIEDIGINGVRMFLPFSVWYHDREKFLDRFDHVLDELSAHGVTMMPVVFNDCVGFAPLPDEIPQTHGWQKYDIGYHGGHREDNPFSGEQCRIGPIYWDKPAFHPFLEMYVHELIGRARLLLGSLERTRQQQPSRQKYPVSQKNVLFSTGMRSRSAVDGGCMELSAKLWQRYDGGCRTRSARRAG